MHDKKNWRVIQTIIFFCILIQIEIYQKVVRRIVLGNRLTIHVGEAHEVFWRVTQQIHLGGLSNVFITEIFPQLKQIFLFEDDFQTWHKHVWGSRRGLEAWKLGM